MSALWDHPDYTLDDVLAEHLLAVAEHVADPPLTGRAEPTLASEVASSHADDSATTPVSGAPSKWDSPSTSYAAGASITPEGIAASEAWVLRMVEKHGPVTDDALLHLFEQEHTNPDTRPWTPQRLRTARNELTKRGRIKKHDNEGRTARGRAAKRWALSSTEAVA